MTRRFTVDLTARLRYTIEAQTREAAENALDDHYALVSDLEATYDALGYRATPRVRAIRGDVEIEFVDEVPAED